MYNVHDTMLGEVAPASTPSLWDSFSNLVSTGVSAGFNIYNKTQQIKQQQQQTAAMQTYARQAQVAYTQPMTGVQPGMVAYSPYGGGSIFDGWMMPAVIGGGALILLLALRK